MENGAAEERATGGENQGASNAAPGAARRAAQPTQVIDELAQEEERIRLLDKLEGQLKGKPNYSRLLFCFSVPDDRKIQGQVDSEFQVWLRDNPGVSGVLLYIGQAGTHYLEGTTELLFKALEQFYSYSQEVSEDEASKAPRAHSPRPALISGIRVLYHTELKGVRSSMSWCSYVHASKLQGGQTTTIDDSNCSELVFTVYKKFLLLCLKASESLKEGSSFDAAQGQYKRLIDMMPTAEDVLILLSKNATDLFFTYHEFEKVFMAPFQCVLHSELLWPIPPALSY